MGTQESGLKNFPAFVVRLDTVLTTVIISPKSCDTFRNGFCHIPITHPLTASNVAL